METWTVCYHCCMQYYMDCVIIAVCSIIWTVCCHCCMQYYMDCVIIAVCSIIWTVCYHCCMQYHMDCVCIIAVCSIIWTVCYHCCMQYHMDCVLSLLYATTYHMDCVLSLLYAVSYGLFVIIAVCSIINSNSNIFIGQPWKAALPKYKHIINTHIDTKGNEMRWRHAEGTITLTSGTPWGPFLCSCLARAYIDTRVLI